MSEPSALNDASGVSNVLKAVLVVLVAAVLAVPIWIVRRPLPVRPRPAIVAAPQRVVSQAEVPDVAPVRYQPVDRDDARAWNASVPFVGGPNPAAAPFVLGGSADSKARAIDCLATAELYEAGDDETGQRAVAQVIINRARHPAFPKSICGVVFQGSERPGCQFSFACDGAMTRWQPNGPMWERARAVAKDMLNGAVFGEVGYATFYHTDWVVPYWSASLDKIAEVHTHLFFKWSGWWGSAAAFKVTLRDEPVIAALADVSDAHRVALAQATSGDAGLDLVSAELDDQTGDVGDPQPLPADRNAFLVTLDGSLSPDRFQALAARACGPRPYCKLMAWTNKAATPSALPLGDAQIAAMAFSYLRDRDRNYDKALWNCRQFRRADPAQCMKQQMLMPLPGVSPAPTAPLADMPRSRTFRVETGGTGTPPDLTGVRRKGQENKSAAPPADNKPAMVTKKSVKFKSAGRPSGR